MDLFKFHTPTGVNEATHLTGGGEYINGLLTKEWIDRYRDAGSVTLTSRAERGLRELLPEGTLIGLRGNTNVMMIEDHQLKDDDQAIVTTTGRSLESFLEQRAADDNQDPYPTGGGETQDIVFDSDPQWLTWVQAESLLINHLTGGSSGNDKIHYLEIVDDVKMAAEDGTREGRTVSRSDLYSAVKGILDVDNIGWRIVRPGPWSPAADPVNNLALVIHDGYDRRDEITMSYESGDIESADYLWSLKPYKNVALVSGKWIEVLVGDTSKTNLDRRVLVVDGKDIDEDQPATPTGLARTFIIAAMTSRGQEALAKQKKVALASVTPSKGVKRYKYGVDYDIGDIVTVRGNYTESRPMLVSEYVYIEDENGEQGYPTLEVLEEE